MKRRSNSERAGRGKASGTGRSEREEKTVENYIHEPHVYEEGLSVS